MPSLCKSGLGRRDAVKQRLCFYWSTAALKPLLSLWVTDTPSDCVGMGKGRCLALLITYCLPGKGGLSSYVHAMHLGDKHSTSALMSLLHLISTTLGHIMTASSVLTGHYNRHSRLEVPSLIAGLSKPVVLAFSML